MINLLLNRFVENADDVKNPKVRQRVGTLSSFVGIFCNVILFIGKFLMGTLANSISIISDSFNNLSDCLSCLITLASYKLAAKPADKDHPFGHGRIEYLSSLLIAFLIGLVGFEFLTSSFDKILNPEPLIFNWPTVVTLVFAILVKIWMGKFNQTLGRRYNSITMSASSQDSFNDSITTAVTLVGLAASLFTDLPIDGIIGCFVSFIILKGAYGIIKDTTDILLGQPADEETIEEIKEIVLAHPQILGVHDLIVHNYGPGKMMATLHAEIDSDSDIMEAHEVVDNIETELYQKLQIITTIHMDPLDLHNPLLNQYKEFVTSVLEEIDGELSMHDFRMVPGQEHTNIVFDILITDKYREHTEELKDQIDQKVKEVYPQLNTVITFDNQY